jgi:hypothetical protein
MEFVEVTNGTEEFRQWQGVENPNAFISEDGQGFEWSVINAEGEQSGYVAVYEEAVSSIEYVCR